MSSSASTDIDTDYHQLPRRSPFYNMEHLTKEEVSTFRKLISLHNRNICDVAKDAGRYADNAPASMEDIYQAGLEALVNWSDVLTAAERTIEVVIDKSEVFNDLRLLIEGKFEEGTYDGN